MDPHDIAISAGGVNSICTLFTMGYVYTLFHLLFAPTAQAGTCWVRMGTNGRCQYEWESGVSKEKCCHGTGIDWAWSPHDNITSSRRFYWQVIENGAPQCHRCHETCENVVCGDGKKCKIRRGEPRCVCAPDCALRNESRERRRMAVCGSDGRTYRHRCAMLKYNCRHSESIYVDYYGKCKRSCADVSCETGKHCVSDQNGLPHCLVCRQDCTRHLAGGHRPVCGSDGVTYPSMCHFRQATCYGGGKISIAYRGTCRENITCAEMNCLWGQRCLRDLSRSPGSPGHLQCLTCDTLNCNMLGNRSPVCGTDGNTYSSWCRLRRTACQTGTVIKTKHNGVCHQGEGGSVDNYYYSSGSASFE